MRVDPEETEHGRCTATNRQGEQCGQPAMGEHGKCYYHGGKTPMKHGIYSDVVREEDREILTELEKRATAIKLEQTLNLQLMKLRRAVELTESPDRTTTFWDSFMQLVESAGEGEELDPRLVRELTQMLDTPGRAQRELMDLIRKTAKDLHKITDGEKITHEHGVDTEELEELTSLIDDVY